MKGYTVGKLARAANVSRDAVRLYEQIGLLPRAERGDNNYRFFPEDCLALVLTIKRLQQMGFRLEEISEFFTISHGEGHLCPQVQEFLKKKIRLLEKRIQDMIALTGVLKSAARDCEEQVDGIHCPLMERLVAFRENTQILKEPEA